MRHSEDRRDEESSKIPGTLSESDKIRIRTACDDIPHSLTPFKDWGVSCDELREDIATKRMRRFGAILRHQDAGFAFNAMVCFRLDDRTLTSSLQTSDESGINQKTADSRHSDNPAMSHSDNLVILEAKRRGTIISRVDAWLEESCKVMALAKQRYISHCYERPTFEDFPYNLYAMMHAQTPEELDGYIKESAALLDNPKYVVLHSLKELKKTSFRFFA